MADREGVSLEHAPMSMTANRGRCTIALCRFVHASALIRAR